MRLIDADALTKILEDKMFNSELMCPVIKILDVMSILEEQPTAYNVDAVVEELEKNLLHSVDAKAEVSIAMSGVSKNMYYGEETAYTKAIEIVKAGGVDILNKYSRCKDCEYLHENGNCLKVGGFYSAVDDKDCVKEGSD